MPNIFVDELPLIRSCPELNEIRLAEEIKDLTIEVQDGVVVYAHRIVMAARVPSLRETLRGRHRRENCILSWPTVPLSVATAFVNYAYTGQVQMTQENVRGLVLLARLMDVPVLENWGVQFMTRSLSLEGLATAWDFAEFLRLNSLTAKCLRLMKTHFQSVIPSDLFVRLPADTVLTLLRNDSLPVTSEQQVIAAISRWVGPGTEADNERLRVHAPAMLKEVRWLQTTDQFRQHLFDTDGLFQNSFGCARFMLQVEDYMHATNKPQCPFNARPRQGVAEGGQTGEVERDGWMPRIPPTGTFFLFGRQSNRDKCSVVRFDPQLGWGEEVALMEERGAASYSFVAGSIFVIGGLRSSSHPGPGSRLVEEFIVGERRWRKRAALTHGRCCHGAAIVKIANAGGSGEKALIGVFGGTYKEGESWTSLSTCEVYELSRDRWYVLPALREKRWGPATSRLPGDSRIFVFGGDDGPSAGLASVEYCRLGANWKKTATVAPTADFWQPAAPMPTARRASAAADFRGRIIVAGGCKGNERLNVVEMFSPPDTSCHLGQWTVLASMRQPRSYFALVSSTDAVFALGTNDEPANTVETLTAPPAAANSNNDFTFWRWSAKNPLDTLCWIDGAVRIHK